MKKVLLKTLTVLILIGIITSCRERDKIEAASATLSDVATSDIQVFSAKLSASITKSSSNPVSEHGFAFSKTSENPEADNTSIKNGAIDPTTPTPIAFSGSLSGLEAKTDYFVRAYATTSSGTSYSKTSKFTTSDIVQPGVQTVDATDITINSANLTGTISTKGTHAITERGVVWGTAANPTTANSKASIAGDATTFPNNFTVNAAGLNLNTSYNYRAYVIMNSVTSYGENKTFKTQDMTAPGIRTDDDPKVGDNVAVAWGTLTSKGSHPISEYGICWNTSANPTAANSKKAYTGDVGTFPKQFDASMQNLNPATTYHYRAYVIMNGVTTYGDNKNFTTGVSEPRVTTGDIFNISGRGTVLTGIVNSQGSFPLTEIGIVYGPNSNPTTANTKLSKSGAGVTFPHNFEFVERGGFAGTGAVYFRAYVISNGKTYYGSSKIARSVPPTLVTGTSNLNGSVYTLEGSITSYPTSPIVEYGIVWVRDKNVVSPTTANSKLSTSVPSTTLLLLPFKVSKTLNLSTIGNCQGVSFRVYCITSDGNTYYSSNVGSFGTPGCVN